MTTADAINSRRRRHQQRYSSTRIKRARDQSTAWKP